MKRNERCEGAKRSREHLFIPPAFKTRNSALHRSIRYPGDFRWLCICSTLRKDDKLLPWGIFKPGCKGECRGREKNVKEKMLGARRKLREPEGEMRREWVEWSLGKAQIATVKESKRKKRPGARRSQYRQGSGVSRLAVDSPLLHVLLQTRDRVGCDHFCLVGWG